MIGTTGSSACKETTWSTRLQRGEDGAIEGLVDRYGAWIHRVTRRILDDSRDAEEITQDVLWIVVRKIHTFNGEAAFSKALGQKSCCLLFVFDQQNSHSVNV